jgi:hypothetical protein
MGRLIMVQHWDMYRCFKFYSLNENNILESHRVHHDARRDGIARDVIVLSCVRRWAMPRLYTCSANPASHHAVVSVGT